MSFIKKIKSQYEMWKINKYTRRRSAMTANFAQKDTEFYRHHYVDGVYSSTGPTVEVIDDNKANGGSFVKQTLNRKKSTNNTQRR
ncbi:7939_t:CDS:2 [Ambispora leptoticha]|uniref:7939_t:CDS:1 n=1 Tax=Ambispora leptoticha TaxID=144679 RepID=A0A9N9F3A1_9GLOM|nr:7939_t:CDS:2 [Ambispora leptoticha]